MTLRTLLTRVLDELTRIREAVETTPASSDRKPTPDYVSVTRAAEIIGGRREASVAWLRSQGLVHTITPPGYASREVVCVAELRDSIRTAGRPSKPRVSTQTRRRRSREGRSAVDRVLGRAS